MLELRHDALTGAFVLVAPGRAARPHTTAATGARDAGRCPFCPGNESETPPEIVRVGTDDGPGWHVRVFPNLYPIVGGPDAGPGATGAHEVVVLSPDHDRDLGRLDDAGASAVFTVLRDRARALAAAGHAYVQVAVNHRREAGASIAHPHAQVLALDFVPPAVHAALARARTANADLVVADHARADADGSTVSRVGDTAVWCGAGSAAPYEMRVAALGAGARFADADAKTLDDTARAVRDALRRLAAVLESPPYNVVVHDAPAGRDDPYHWWVTVLPRISIPAGFEMGTGVLVETVEPTVAAEQLRAVGDP